MIEAKKNYCIEVPLNDVTSVQYFIQIYQAVHKLLVGDRQTHRQEDRHTSDLISLLSFLESRLKMLSNSY
jgi:hypothetical protein